MHRRIRWLRTFVLGVAVGVLAGPWLRGTPRPAEHLAAGLAGPVIRISPDAQDKAVGRLDTLLPAVRYDGLGFGAIIDDLRNASGANIFVDWKALAGSVHRELPVTLARPRETFSSRLGWVLREAGGDSVVLGAVVDGQVVFVSMSTALQVDRVTRMHDVRHLIRPAHRRADVATLVQRVRGVDPLSWNRPYDEVPASVKELAGHLIVTHSAVGQDRIAAVLADPGFGPPPDEPASSGSVSSGGASMSPSPKSMAWPVTRPARAVPLSSQKDLATSRGR